ncbi:hypothetical protein EV361DRAFT_871332 [Lentinula raphanica]|nr:hypothetical protein EV361DRAFT_871332 [Lentinula raphanica]
MTTQDHNRNSLPPHKISVKIVRPPVFFVKRFGCSDFKRRGYMEERVCEARRKDGRTAGGRKETHVPLILLPVSFSGTLFHPIVNMILSPRQLRVYLVEDGLDARPVKIVL